MKDELKVGDTVELLFINDTWTKLQKGSRGTVVQIDDDTDEPLIWVQWENGERLALISGIDKFKVVKK